MKRNFSNAVRTFHVWAGLSIGLLFCLMSLSGSVLVLRPLIEDGLRPVWIPKSTGRPAQVLTEAGNNILRKWPAARVVSISLPPDPRAPIEFGVRTGDDEVRVFADARSGEVLGTFSLPWLEWLTDLHHHLQVKSVGKKVVGAIGILLFLSSLSGLLIWARRSNRWRLAGRRTYTGRQYTRFDLHRSIGVIGNALLLFVAATGIVVAFPQTMLQILGGLRRTEQALPLRGAHAQEGSVSAAFEEYVTAAERAVPEGTVTQLRLGRKGAVTAYVRVPGDLRERGSARVDIDSGTARVLSIDKPEDWPVSKKIVEAATPLHYAEWGGLTLRVFWFLIGLMPSILFVSGVMMWRAPYVARQKKARAAEASAALNEKVGVA